MGNFNLFKDSYSSEIEKSIGFTGQSHDFYTGVKGDVLRALINDHFPGEAKPRLLDIGCGHGLIHPYLAGSYSELIGIDMAEDVIAMAGEANPQAKYLVYDGSHLPFPDDSFDLAYCICVMHHVPPPQWPDFVAEMSRVVKPGGGMVIIEHNPWNPFARLIVALCKMDDDAVLLSERMVKKLFLEAGIEDISRQSVLFTPFSSTFFRAFDRHLRWLPLGAQYFMAGRVPGRCQDAPTQ